MGIQEISVSYSAVCGYFCGFVGSENRSPCYGYMSLRFLLITTKHEIILFLLNRNKITHQNRRVRISGICDSNYLCKSVSSVDKIGLVLKGGSRTKPAIIHSRGRLCHNDVIPFRRVQFPEFPKYAVQTICVIGAICG